MQLSLCQIVNPLASTGAEISAFSQNQEKYAKWNLPFFIFKKEHITCQNSSTNGENSTTNNAS